jgi:Flp pilus assembly protein TadD
MEAGEMLGLASTEGEWGRRLLVVSALIGALATAGCASMPWSRSQDPLSPGFDSDIYRDLIKKQRARNVPPEKRSQTLAQKLREGDAARASGDRLRAMWNYLHAHKLDRDDPAPLQRIALLHLKKDPNRAEALFAHLAEMHPDSPSAQTGLGLARLAKRDFEGARTFLMRALELDPEWSPALSALAVTSDQLALYLEAQVLYRRALEAGPVDYKTLNNLGVSYIASGDYPQAVSVLRDALLIEHRDPAVYNNLGLALGRLAQYDEALLAFQQARDEAAALNNLAYVHFLNGDHAEATALYERVLLLDSEYTLTVLRNLGKARRALVEAQEPVATRR